MATVVPVTRIAKLLGISESQLNDLQVVVEEAESLIAERVGPLTETTVITHANGGAAITLAIEPARSLTSVVSLDGVVVDIGDLDLDGATVRRKDNGRFPSRRYVVTYVAGHAADGSGLPKGLERAVVELTRHLWRPKRGVDRTPRTAADADTDRPAGFLWPYAVLAALEPYTTPGFA